MSRHEVAIPPIFSEFWRQRAGTPSQGENGTKGQRTLLDFAGSDKSAVVGNVPMRYAQPQDSQCESKALIEAQILEAKAREINERTPSSEFSLLKAFKVLPLELLQALPRDCPEGYDSQSKIDDLCAEVQSTLYNSESAIHDLLAWKDTIIKRANLASSVKLSLAVLCSQIYRAKSEMHEPLYQLIKEARCHSREWSLKQESLTLLELKFKHQEYFLDAAVKKIEFLEDELKNERSRRIANRWEQIVSRLLAVQRMMINASKEQGEGPTDRLTAAGYIPGSSNVSRFFKARLMKQSAMVQTDPVEHVGEGSTARNLTDVETKDLHAFAKELETASSLSKSKRNKSLPFLRVLKSHYPAFVPLLEKLQRRSLKAPQSNRIAYFTVASDHCSSALDGGGPIRKRALSVVHLDTLFPQYDFTLLRVDPKGNPIRGAQTVLAHRRANSEGALYELRDSSIPLLRQIEGLDGKTVDLRRYMPKVLLRGAKLDTNDQDIQDLAALENGQRFAIKEFVEDTVATAKQKFDSVFAPRLEKGVTGNVELEGRDAEAKSDESGDPDLSDNGQVSLHSDRSLATNSFEAILRDNKAIDNVQRTLDATTLVIPGMVNSSLASALQSFPSREEQAKTFTMLDMMKLSVLHAQQLWFMHTSYSEQLEELQRVLSECLEREATGKKGYERQLEVEKTRNRVLTEDYSRLRDSYGRQAEQLQHHRKKFEEIEREADQKIQALTQRLTTAFQSGKLPTDEAAMLEKFQLRKQSKKDPHRRSVFKIPFKDYTSKIGMRPLAKPDSPFQWNNDASRLSFFDRMSYFAEQKLQRARTLRQSAVDSERANTESKLQSQNLLVTGSSANCGGLFEADFMPLPQIKNPALDPTRPLKMFLEKTGHVVATPWAGKFKQGRPLDSLDYPPERDYPHSNNSKGQAVGTRVTTMTTSTSTTVTTTTTTVVTESANLEAEMEAVASEGSSFDICNLFEVAKQLQNV